jgi:putative transposase
LRATCPDEVWALDFSFDQPTDTKTLKVLSVTDEFTREALAIRVDRSITADLTVALLEEIVASTGRSPACIRMDNGPEMTAHALRDWRRYACTDTSDSELGTPSENPHIESPAGKLRDELLDVEAFATRLEAETRPRTTASTTTHDDPIRRSATGPRRRSPQAGPHYPSGPHAGWYRKRGQVNAEWHSPASLSGAASTSFPPCRLACRTAPDRA